MKKNITLILTTISSFIFSLNVDAKVNCPDINQIKTYLQLSKIQNVIRSNLDVTFDLGNHDNLNITASVKENDIEKAKELMEKMQNLYLVYGSSSPVGKIICSYNSSEGLVSIYAVS